MTPTVLTTILRKGPRSHVTRIASTSADTRPIPGRATRGPGVGVRATGGLKAACRAGVSLLAMMLAAQTAMAAPAAKATTPAATAASTTAGQPAAAPASTGTDHMVLEADQVVYDDKAQTVTAIGKVHVYYQGNVLTSRTVTYHRSNKRVVAEGDVRLTDREGNVLTSPRMDVTDGFAEGFVDSLRIESIDRSRFAAESAKRTDGNKTVFEKGVYTACQTCVNEPEKPPFWQIKAVRIIHDQQEKTVYYEDAKLEMLGVPIAYVPFFMHPDPSERRKTGFLLPRVIDSTSLGLGVQVPFYWAPTADWDATFSPVAMSRQGVLGDVEVRHRFDAGSASIRGFAINQLHPEAFVNTSGDRPWRGAFNSSAAFRINNNWSWGWNGTLATDRRFLSDYHLNSSTDDLSASTLHLTGEGKKSWFDARLYKFSATSDDNTVDRAGNTLMWRAGSNLQDKLPVVHPVVDYDLVSQQPVAGGEVSGHFNSTSLSRTRSDIDTFGQVYGLAGTFTRVSAQIGWRRQFIDDYGQIFTPSASLRGDVFYTQSRDDSLVDFVRDGTVGRLTPTLALDYAYPFVAATRIGAHTLEPIGQLVVRPNEQWSGRLPNEDAQSLVFDDTTLFRTDKFSGWDRAEGGTRLNLGTRYTFNAASGGTLSTLFGRSFLIAGTNSFAAPSYDALIRQAQLGRPVPLSAFGSGLENNASDWVGRIALDSTQGFRLSAQGRFGGDDFRLNRADIQASGTSGPLSASVTWAYRRMPHTYYDLLTAYQATGLVQFAGAAALRNALANERSEIQTAANLRLTPNWRLFGGIRYDIKDRFLSGENAGVGYDNDSFSLSLSYNDTSYATTVSTVHDQTLYLRFGFRTLGDGQLSNSLAGAH